MVQHRHIMVMALLLLGASPVPGRVLDLPAPATSDVGETKALAAHANEEGPTDEAGLKRSMDSENPEEKNFARAVKAMRDAGLQNLATEAGEDPKNPQGIYGDQPFKVLDQHPELKSKVDELAQTARGKDTAKAAEARKKLGFFLGLEPTDKRLDIMLDRLQARSEAPTSAEPARRLTELDRMLAKSKTASPEMKKAYTAEVARLAKEYPALMQLLTNEKFDHDRPLQESLRSLYEMRAIYAIRDPNERLGKLAGMMTSTLYSMDPSQFPDYQAALKQANAAKDLKPDEKALIHMMTRSYNHYLSMRSPGADLAPVQTGQNLGEHETNFSGHLAAWDSYHAGRATRFSTHMRNAFVNSPDGTPNPEAVQHLNEWINERANTLRGRGMSLDEARQAARDEVFRWSLGGDSDVKRNTLAVLSGGLHHEPGVGWVIPTGFRASGGLMDSLSSEMKIADRPVQPNGERFAAVLRFDQNFRSDVRAIFHNGSHGYAGRLSSVDFSTAEPTRPQASGQSASASSRPAETKFAGVPVQNTFRVNPANNGVDTQMHLAETAALAATRWMPQAQSPAVSDTSLISSGRFTKLVQARGGSIDAVTLQQMLASPEVAERGVADLAASYRETADSAQGAGYLHTLSAILDTTWNRGVQTGNFRDYYHYQSLIRYQGIPVRARPGEPLVQ